MLKLEGQNFVSVSADLGKELVVAEADMEKLKNAKLVKVVFPKGVEIPEFTEKAIAVEPEQ